ncbi:hypothetical protein LZ198_28700 [Myxococcus sp. K15C18031901]|uniref:hypothetical protein n=1 Tax=Myxococcus dinghuensis TaxID=2906761 RepID=UPI0020A80683|nr:hypothetical protein [Myxococcus dinghuensis]MCP3102864.1 hypothetical protein [Myxococcus dinghuensis]
MSGEGTRPVADVLVGLTRFRVGRFLLWTASGLIALLSVAAGPDRQGMLGLAAVLAVFAAIGTWNAWREERDTSQRGALGWLLPRLTFGALLFGGAMLLVWWRGRRAGAVAPLPPPSPQDVDRWAEEELRAETRTGERLG